MANSQDTNERLAQPVQDWDWRHPKAQALIGAKARLEITLRLVEQLLEDPHFETTASDMEYWEPLHDKLQERLAQPVQEPFGYFQLDLRLDAWVQNRDSNKGVAFYTTPPRREWVGLTDARITKIIDKMPNKMKGFMVDWDLYEFTRAIEAAHGIKGETNE